uniref:CBS domain-containing protein n=1 Tax=Lotharella globosa TaxID=91324 RepID=A0A7S4DXS9_9EUKA
MSAAVTTAVLLTLCIAPTKASVSSSIVRKTSSLPLPQIRKQHCARGNGLAGRFAGTRLGTLAVQKAGHTVRSRRLAALRARVHEHVEVHPEFAVQEIRETMSVDPISVQPEADILEVARIMLDRKFAGLPVTDGEGKLVGMVSDLDVMTSELMPGHKGRIDDVDALFPDPGMDWASFRSLKKQLKKIKGKTIGDIMTPTTSCKMITPDTTVDVAANMLIRHRLRRLPVVDAEGRLLGIVTRGDILRSGLRRILDSAGVSA